MDTNHFVLYSDVTEVYHKLIHFCEANRFKVKGTTAQYFSITAKKTSLLFWRSLQMELKIMAVEKKKVEVNVMICQLGKRKPALENEYRISIENFLRNSQ